MRLPYILTLPGDQSTDRTDDGGQAEILMTTLKRSNKYLVVTLIPYLPKTSATFTSILLSD